MKRKLTKRQLEVLRRVVVVGTSGRMLYYPTPESVEMGICQKLARRGYLRVNPIGWGWSFYATVKGVMAVKP